MAELIDERPLDDLKAASLEDLVVDPPQAETPPPDELPEKYRGKQLTDIVRMHQEAEKALGRQSSEVGELRKVVDEFIHTQTQLVTKNKAPVEEVDYYTDPQSAINKTIEAHPLVAELRRNTVNSRQSAAQAEIVRRHPDVETVLGDPKFIEWITASPVRKSLLAKAHSDLDVDSADELFALYKERKNLLSQAVSSEQTARKETSRRAATGGSAVAGEDMGSGKRLRRADIINLMRDDPERYATLAPEIRKAYAENRVF